MLALTERSTLNPMALAGPAVAPVSPVSADGVARAIAQPGGVLVVVEPEGAADAQGLKQLGDLISRGRHRPDVIVVSRSYNPFAFGTALSGLKVAHEKGRGKAFLQGLPSSRPVEAGTDGDGQPVEVAPPPKAPKKDDGVAAPRFCFVGRDEEVDALAALLAEPGPIVVSGPPGAGRTQVVEHALKKAGIRRFPDLYLGWGSAADTLLARLAAMGKDVGDERLWGLLTGDPAARQPLALVQAVQELVASPAMAGRAWVIHHLEYGLGRENDFFRRSRFEILLIALLTGTASFPIVFLSTRQPHFHREGEGANLRRVELAGIKGRFFHEIFDAHKALEFPREKFGPISDRLHGHPFAARMFAIATRVRQDGADLVDDPKFLATESFKEIGPLEKHLARRVEKVPEALRIVLARLAHLRYPVDGTTLANELGVTRKDRLELLSLGLLDMVGIEEDRKYRVHPLVRAQLSWREVSDFDVCEKLADMFASLASKAEGLDKLVLEQEQGRFALAGRSLKLRPRLPLPDHDMWLEAVTGMVRAKQPRLDLVEQRLNECLKADPANSDAWLLRLELVQAMSMAEGPNAATRPAEAMEPVLDEAIAKAPVPELFQQVVSWLLGRRQRAKAITVLEKGLEIFPNESRLHTRLAAVLQRQGRRNEAIDHLRKAMEIDPMLPDSYGLLGLARRDEGLEALPEAETLLREAVRLAPDDPVQLSRLVDLLLDRARVDPDHASALRGEAKALLEDAIKGDRRAPEACLLFATLVREEGGDLERSSWLLGQAKKLTDRGHERARRIVVERAMIDLAKGDLDSAENALRQHIGRDPSHARGFAALGHVLEAREQFIPAHAEYLRAKERTSQNGLEAMFYDQQIKRITSAIEAQAQGLWNPSAVSDEPLPQPGPPSHRVLRRRAGEGEVESIDGPAADAPAPDGGEDVNRALAGDAPPAEGDGWAAPGPHGDDEAYPAAAPVEPAEER
ncbi:MAG: AAA family ATPase [Myxococcota bacterium]